MVKNFWKKHIMLNPPLALVLGFALIIFIGACLLDLPVAVQDGKNVTFIEALFTATSATCVTGLVVHDTGTTFSTFGRVVILLLIQIGGLGFMTFATMISLLIGSKVGISHRILLKESLNQETLEGMVRLVKLVLLFTFIVELWGFVLLSFRFSFDMELSKALFYGLFHSVSMFNNAGFDIMGPISGEYSSFTSYVNDPVVNLTISTLILMGGIGFLVVGEVIRKRRFVMFSLHTKIVLISTLLLTVIGTVLILFLEWNNPKTLQPLTFAGKFLSALFQAVSPRTAGANTINLPDMHLSTVFIVILLMFIGANPGSTGGGIKTTTFATLIGAVWSEIRGKQDITFFKQRIEKETVYKALTVVMGAFAIISLSVIGLSITEHSDDLTKILFEVVSAFGTVGLSLGLTPTLSLGGKIIIMVLMFLGRVGTITLLIALAGKSKKENIKFPKGKIMIG